MNYFGKRIKKIRKDRDLTQQQFAESLGYAHKSTINKIESGVEKMSYQKILVLIKEYSLSAGELFGDDNNKIEPKEILIKYLFPLAEELAEYRILSLIILKKKAIKYYFIEI